jgi:hypothetical protein
MSSDADKQQRMSDGGSSDGAPRAPERQPLDSELGRFEPVSDGSSLGKLDPFVLLLVPSARRAETTREALAYSAAPIAVAVWSKDSTSAVLTTIINAHASLRQSHPAPAREGLRSGAGSDLLDRPEGDDGER